MTAMRATDLEEELEEEWEGEEEGEEFLGAIGSIAKGLLGEEELEEEYEGEEEGEEFLGTLGGIAKGLLGEEEYEGEQEGEEFLGTLGGIAKGLLGEEEYEEEPMVGTAIGGPFGGILGKMASSALGEEEYEEEWEAEEEMESEAEMEAEIATPESEDEMEAEYLASLACKAHSEAEAEAMIGASTTTVLSRRDRRALRKVLPHMVRGTAILTRILRRRRITRPAVRAVPSIVRVSTRQLARRAAAGKPITRKAVARVVANNTRKILGSPRLCSMALKRNVKSARAVRRRTYPLPAAAPMYRRRRASVR